MATTPPLAASPPDFAVGFAGFTRPTTTPVPDQIMDELLPILSGAELKVVLYICRRTLGFQKLSDNISLQQLLTGLVKKNGERLDSGTGLSKTTLLKTLRDLQAKGIITMLHRSSSERGDEATNYRLCYADGVQPPVCQRQVPEREEIGWRRPVSTRGQKTVPGGWSKNCTRGVVKKSRPQETEVQKTETQETDARATNKVTNNTSSALPVFGGGALSDNTFWSGANQADEELRLETVTNTHLSLLEQAPPPNSDAPPSSTLERRQMGARALIALGITAKVAYWLAEHYRLERIEEKLRYLDFFQQYQPDKVKNPCGWLRTAIEDDFAAPDGYAAHIEHLQQLAEQQQREQTAQTQAQAAALLRQQAQAQYETTDVEYQIWTQTLTALETSGQGYLLDLVSDAAILRVTHDTAVIGVSDAFQHELLQEPSTHLALSRTLTQVAGRALVLEFVVLRE